MSWLPHPPGTTPVTSLRCHVKNFVHQTHLLDADILRAPVPRAINNLPQRSVKTNVESLEVPRFMIQGQINYAESYIIFPHPINLEMTNINYEHSFISSS
jgi:hypothetical protein